MKLIPGLTLALLFILSCLPPAGAVEKTALLARPGERLHLFPAGWQFRLDPDEAGLEAGWHRPGNDEAGWQPLLTTRYWAEQLADPVYLQANAPLGRQLTGPATYYGVAWYRVDFQAPGFQPGHQLILELGGVEESCWVFLNGEKIGSQVYDEDKDIHAWNKPRRFEITGRLRSGENRLVIRVRALGGLTGLYNGVLIREQPFNLLAAGLEAWIFSLLAAGPPPEIIRNGPLSAELSDFFHFEDGEYAEESSLLVPVLPGRIIRLTVPVPDGLPVGAYVFSLRYAAAPEDTRPGPDAPFHVRLEGDDRRVLTRLDAPAAADPGWETLETIFTLDDPGRPLRQVCLEFMRPGAYRLGDIRLAPVMPVPPGGR